MMLMQVQDQWVDWSGDHSTFLAGQRQGPAKGISSRGFETNFRPSVSFNTYCLHRNLRSRVSFKNDVCTGARPVGGLEWGPLDRGGHGQERRPQVCAHHATVDHPTQLFFFLTLATGPGRSLSLKLSDTRVYEPEIRARLGKRNTPILGFCLNPTPKINFVQAS